MVPVAPKIFLRRKRRISNVAMSSATVVDLHASLGTFVNLAKPLTPTTSYCAAQYFSCFVVGFFILHFFTELELLP